MKKYRWVKLNYSYKIVAVLLVANAHEVFSFPFLPPTDLTVSARHILWGIIADMIAAAWSVSVDQ